MNTRIIVADSRRLIREGLRQILETRENFCVVAEASDGPEAVCLSIEKQPDIAVVEALLPRLSGTEAIGQIRRGSKKTRCIVVSENENGVYVEQAFRAGAAGYVATSASSDEFIEAIDVVRSGRSYLSPILTGHVIEALTGPTEERKGELQALTAREREVLQLIAEGLTSKEIATHLNIATRTAEAHRAHLMKKLNINKASSLVRFAIREGLVAP